MNWILHMIPYVYNVNKIALQLFVYITNRTCAQFRSSFSLKPNRTSTEWTERMFVFMLMCESEGNVCLRSSPCFFHLIWLQGQVVLFSLVNVWMVETPPGHPDLPLTSNPSIYSPLSLSLLSTNGSWRTVTLAWISTSRAWTPFPSVLQENSGWTTVDSLGVNLSACRKTFLPELFKDTNGLYWGSSFVTWKATVSKLLYKWLFWKHKPHYNLITKDKDNYLPCNSSFVIWVGHTRSVSIYQC